MIEYSNRVWAHSKQQGTKLILLLALADMTNEKDLYCFPSLETLQQRSRLANRQNVIRSLADIEKDREVWIEHSRGRNHSNAYIVTAGMSATELAQILVSRFQYTPEDAIQKAYEFINKNVPLETHLSPKENVSSERENVSSELIKCASEDTLIRMNQNRIRIESEGGNAALSQTDEFAPQTEAFPPPSEALSTGDPFMDVALKRFQKRQQNGGRHIANRGGQWPGIDAKVPAAERLPLVERLIDMHGLRAAIDVAQDDSKLADMHKLAADLYVMGFKTLADIETVYQRFQKDWRGKTPTGRQLITIASAMKQTPAQPPKQHVVPPPVIAPDWMTYGIAEENQWKVH